MSKGKKGKKSKKDEQILTEKDKIKLSSLIGDEGVEEFKEMAGQSISDELAMEIIEEADVDLANAKAPVEIRGNTYYVYLGQTPGNLYTTTDTGERVLNDTWADEPPAQVPHDFTTSILVPRQGEQDQPLSIGMDSKEQAREVFDKSGTWYLVIGNNRYESGGGVSINYLWAKETEIK